MSDRDTAFAEYFAARSDAMRGTAYLLCGDWHRAEDLVQTAFTKLYLAWNRISRHEVLDAYVRQTLIRTFLDERRRFHEAQFADRVNGVEVWDYLARAAVTRGGGTGQVVAEVHGAGNEMTGDPCTLTLRFWGMTGECTVVTVGSLKVGVVTQVTGSDRRLDQWAGYRHPDGTVVFIAQSRRFDENAPALAALPFPVPQLAALAVDERFHLR